ncbi:Protein turtle-like protein, partial [Leptotrombidium deliense]
QFLQLGKQGVIKCYASANPPIQFITWRKNNRLFDVQSNQGFSMLPNGSVLIENVSKEDEGSYECTAYNSQGTMGSSRKMQITVKGF